MKRYITTALVVGLFLGTMTTSANAHAGSNSRIKPYMNDRCRYEMLDDRHSTVHEVTHTAACAESKWAVPGGLSYALTIGRRESGLRYNAWNSSSGACGVFQHLSRYWAGRQNAFDGPVWRLGESCKNARANIIVTMRMVHRMWSWSHWTTAY